MHDITNAHWYWVGGMGLLTFVLLFFAAESVVKGKFNAPSILLAGFLLILASFTMSFFLSSVTDLQQGRLDTFHDISREWDIVKGMVRRL